MFYLVSTFRRLNDFRFKKNGIKHQKLEVRINILPTKILIPFHYENIYLGRHYDQMLKLLLQPNFYFSLAKAFISIEVRKKCVFFFGIRAVLIDIRDRF